MSGRAVLVVGRSGQLATDLAAAGPARGETIAALGRPDLDITDPDAIARALDRIEPAYVVNASAYTQVDRAESEPDLAFALNRDGPRHLARLCRLRRIPLVHVSTDQVFDGEKDGPYAEADHPNPLCTYGRSKLAGEIAVAEEEPNHLVVRVSWLFGPSGDNFVTKLLAWAHDRPTLNIVSDQRGRPTYGPALAQALLTLGARMIGEPAGRPGGLLHLAGASVMTRYEQAVAVVAASAARGGPSARIEPILTRDFLTPARRPLNAELDAGLARRRYGLTLDPFEADLARTLDALIGPARERG